MKTEIKRQQYEHFVNLRIHCQVIFISFTASYVDIIYNIYYVFVSVSGSQAKAKACYKNHYHSICIKTLCARPISYTEKPEWIIWLIWAKVGQYTDKMTQKCVKNESFCPCSDTLWLKWVKWFTRGFQCIYKSEFIISLFISLGT